LTKLGDRVFTVFIHKNNYAHIVVEGNSYALRNWHRNSTPLPTGKHNFEIRIDNSVNYVAMLLNGEFYFESFDTSGIVPHS